jgi:predicted acylesterase/phospholipase RssA
MAGREPYSPRHRTALVLTGAGTAGAYHAGVLRALAEAGVRIDLVAGHGAGAVGAVFTAIEGGPALWGPDGLWRQKAVAGFYGWRPELRALGWAAAAALALVFVPLAGLAGGLVVYPASLLLSLLGLDAGTTLAGSYAALVREA